MTEVLRPIDRSAQTNGQSLGKGQQARLAQGLLDTHLARLITAGN